MGSVGLVDLLRHTVMAVRDVWVRAPHGLVILALNLVKGGSSVTQRRPGPKPQLREGVLGRRVHTRPRTPVSTGACAPRPPAPSTLLRLGRALAKEHSHSPGKVDGQLFPGERRSHVGSICLPSKLLQAVDQALSRGWGQTAGPMVGLYAVKDLSNLSGQLVQYRRS